MYTHEIYGENVQPLTPEAEFTRLAIAARHAQTMVLFNHEGASVIDAEEKAQAAVEFAEQHPGIALELVCVDSLRSIVSGSLRTADQLQIA